jgi:hypothetical protein
VSRPDRPDMVVTDVPAQLDTDADFTVFPARLVEELHLVQLDEAPVAGFGGHILLAPTYLIGLEVQPFDRVLLRAIAERNEQFVLLGREVLNRFRIDLDGPNLVVEIRFE